MEEPDSPKITQIQGSLTKRTTKQFFQSGTSKFNVINDYLSSLAFLT